MKYVYIVAISHIVHVVTTVMTVTAKSRLVAFSKVSYPNVYQRDQPSELHFRTETDTAETRLW